MRLLRVAGLGGALAAASCEAPIDTTRDVAMLGTLGHDIYGALCDRLGASSFTEDWSGASFASICHYDAQGIYGDFVDTSGLPPASGDASVRARQLSVAKLERMAQRRSELIDAVNAAFPDVQILDLTTPDPNDVVRLHDALLAFSGDISRLYEENPAEPGGPPMMPMVTRALGRLFGAIEASPEARAALERMAGRLGYRPYQAALGAVRVALGYPQLRPMARSLLEVLGPNGTAVNELQQTLTVLKAELLTSVPVVSGLPPYELVGDPAAAQPNRARSAIEAVAAVLLEEDDAYVEGWASGPPRYLAARDSRGLAIPAGSTPGLGPVPSPFVDLDANAFADVDGRGRFVGLDGLPLPIDSPFFVPNLPFGPSDPYGRPQSTPYEYLDTTRTATGSLAHYAQPLVDPTVYAAPGDPEPWKSEKETLMYALAGLPVLAGPREPAQWDYVSDVLVPANQPCPACLQYQRYRAEDSPIPDLVHGAGQLLAHADSDAVLLALIQLIEEHEDVVARLLKVGLRIKEIADEHDLRAAQGLEPAAELAYETPIWDQAAQVVSGMSSEPFPHDPLVTPGLVSWLVDALADPLLVSQAPQDPAIPDPPAQHYGETMTAYMSMRDSYRYDVTNMNGPPINVTDGDGLWTGTLRNPHNLVDRMAPNTGVNRSMWELSLQMIYDTFGARGCNKEGAKVYVNMLDMYWPLIPPNYTECELMSMDNIGAFYFDAMLPINHPKRSELVIKPATLQTMLDALGLVMTPDEFLESSSGIAEFTLHPSAAALNRLLFFGAYSDQFGAMSDYDVTNADSDTMKFINTSSGDGAMEPTCGVVSPKNGNGVSHTTNVGDTLRRRDFGVGFGWERLGFMYYSVPIAKALARLRCNADVTVCDLTTTPDGYRGEIYYGKLAGVLWRHWPGPDHGSYCDSNLSPSDPRYCSGAGVNRYEPILADAFAADLIPTLHEFGKVAQALQVTVQRGPHRGQVVSGNQILELVTKVMFDQQYAAEVGVTDRKGNVGTTWVDGTPQAQITPYAILAEALHRMDQRFVDACSCNGLDGDALAACQQNLPTCEAEAAIRKSKWKRARSNLVDEFLAVEGEGSNARFKNRALPRLLVGVLQAMRQQLNANCPERESGVACTWASRDLGAKVNKSLGGPLMAAVFDLVDKINVNDAARRGLGQFLAYALKDGTSAEALQGILASLSDIVQLLSDDRNLSPLLNAAATAAAPANDAGGPGVLDRTIQVLYAMTGDEYDRYHVLDWVLPQLVTPTAGGQGLTPVEVFLNAIADINREDAASNEPLNAQDYEYAFRTVREFMVNETRGFEQLYYIVQNRPR
jgi:hypothetical protein